MLKPEPCRISGSILSNPRVMMTKDTSSSIAGGSQPNNTLTVMAALNDTFNKRYYGASAMFFSRPLFGTRFAMERWAGEHHRDQGKGPRRRRRVADRIAGVQSNQYPRGRDLALQFVAHGLPTIMGGFHVSGYPQSRNLCIAAVSRPRSARPRISGTMWSTTFSRATQTGILGERGHQAKTGTATLSSR